MEWWEATVLTPLSMNVGQSGCYRAVVNECGLIINECGFGGADIINQCGLANRDVIGPGPGYYQSLTPNLGADTHRVFCSAARRRLHALVQG